MQTAIGLISKNGGTEGKEAGRKSGHCNSASNIFPSGLVCLTLNSGFTADQLVERARVHPRFAVEYDNTAGLIEGYTVGEHTVMALELRRRYQIGRNLLNPPNPSSALVGARGIDFALLVHDLQKFKEGEQKSTTAEHKRTTKFLRPFLNKIPFSDVQAATLLDIMFNNDLGSLLYNAVQRKRPTDEQKRALLLKRRAGSLALEEYYREVASWEQLVTGFALRGAELDSLIEGCANSFRTRAAILRIPVLAHLDNQVAFTQADIGAYTYDARLRGQRGIPSLDYLFKRQVISDAGDIFVVTADKKRLKFSPFFEYIYKLLEKKLAE